VDGTIPWELLARERGGVADQMDTLLSFLLAISLCCMSTYVLKEARDVVKVRCAMYIFVQFGVRFESGLRHVFLLFRRAAEAMAM
jgi:hypothetical protein